MAVGTAVLVCPSAPRCPLAVIRGGRQLARLLDGRELQRWPSDAGRESGREFLIEAVCAVRGQAHLKLRRIKSNPVGSLVPVQGRPVAVARQKVHVDNDVGSQSD